MISGRALLYALLLRAAGPGRGVQLGAWALLAGAAAGVVASRYLSAGSGGGPDLVGRLFTAFPRSALYCIGFAFAWRTPAFAGVDAMLGWTQQLLAAGATRDRYVVALALASAAAATLAYVAAVAGWLLALSLLGGPAPVLPTLLLLPAALPWLLAAAAFGAAALALTGGAGAAQALMAVSVAAPWLVVLSRVQRMDDGMPVWLELAFRITPRLPLDPSLRGTASSTLFTAMALALAFLLSRRVLRVR